MFIHMFVLNWCRLANGSASQAALHDHAGACGTCGVRQLVDVRRHADTPRAPRSTVDVRPDIISPGPGCAGSNWMLCRL